MAIAGFPLSGGMVHQQSRESEDNGNERLSRSSSFVSSDQRIFPNFTQLPPELRQAIWEEACDSLGQSEPSVCIFKSEDEKDPRTSLQGKITYSNLVARPCHRRSPLRLTCKESLDVVHECMCASKTRPYDPAKDILYVPAEDFYAFCDVVTYQPQHAHWVSRVRHVALALSEADRGLWIPIALPHLVSLESISIVFPQTEGMVDVHAAVPIPETAKGGRGPPMLRKLSEMEAASLQVNANYKYDIGCEVIPIRWMKSAEAYLKAVEEELNFDTRADVGRLQPRCWDYDADKLKLIFEARCFA